MKINKSSMGGSRSSALSMRLKFAGVLALCALGACLLVFHGGDEQADDHQASLAFNKSYGRRLKQAVSSTATTNVLSNKDIVFTPHNRRRLLPSQVVSSIGDAKPSGHWSNSHNVVHVINTRFLQHQSKLVHLQAARLDLFKTFTLPSIVQQTNQEFLWMIWTDAAETSLQKDLIQLLKEKAPNAVLIGLAQDKESNFRELYGHSWTDLSVAIKVGDPELLADYYKASKTHLLLETRLDADDALSHTFVESMQAQAAASMGSSSNTGTMETFCPESHVEWRYYSDGNDEENEQGKLIHFHDEDFCIFSGLTTAWNAHENGDSGRRSLQGLTPTNNGQNCPFKPPPCPWRRHLDALFEQDVVQQARPRGRDLARCDEVDVACYECGGVLECIATDYGRDISVVMDYLTATPAGPFGSGAFCEVNDNVGYPTTCAGQPCTGLQAWTKTEQPPPAHACPKIDMTHCPNNAQEKPSSFATYQVIYCFNGNDNTYDVMLNTCHEQCTSGKCDCEYGGYSFCKDCYKDSGSDPLCLRRLKALPREDGDGELQSVYKSSPAASVLLARTPTAAGMKNVIPNKKGGGKRSIPLSTFENEEDAAWKEMEREFGVGEETVAQLRARLEQDMENILIDAFAGQCTPGHSCKESTKRSLSLLLDKVQHRKA